MRLDGAVALITGGSSGIGAATARALTLAGACPLIAGRDQARLNEVARQTGAVPLRADLADPDGVDELVAAALAEAGRVDLLISNAGVGWAGEIGELTAAKAAELTLVNLLAPIQLARLLIPGMAKQGAGRLVLHVGVSVVVPGVVDTPFFDHRGRPYGRSAPAPIPAERVARAVVRAVSHDRELVFVPRWMRFPAWLHGTAPRTFRVLASRFG
jgi:short-subunit dehydrogenase